MLAGSKFTDKLSKLKRGANYYEDQKIFNGISDVNGFGDYHTADCNQCGCPDQAILELAHQAMGLLQEAKLLQAAS
jgi:hypothetical protein